MFNRDKNNQSYNDKHARSVIEHISCCFDKALTSLKCSNIIISFYTIPKIKLKFNILSKFAPMCQLLSILVAIYSVSIPHKFQYLFSWILFNIVSTLALLRISRLSINCCEKRVLCYIIQQHWSCRKTMKTKTRKANAT